MKILYMLPLMLFPLAGFAEEHEETSLVEHVTATSEPHEKAPAAPAHAGPHWAYVGEAGPEHWGALAPDFHLCAEGHEQSPVDLKWSKQKGSRKLEFHYQAGSPKVIDNGHTVQVNVPSGSYAVIDGHRYELAQFHFHAESEHSFSGRHYPLELHLVHKDKEGHLAVVGVMFDVGARNVALESVFAHLPKATAKEEPLGASLDPAQLLPATHTHYQYSGSLTTPPCSEGVNWTVLNTPLELSDGQLAAFHHFYVKNARPVQPLHDRQPANYR